MCAFASLRIIKNTDSLFFLFNLKNSFNTFKITAFVILVDGNFRGSESSFGLILAFFIDHKCIETVYWPLFIVLALNLNVYLCFELISFAIVFKK